MNIGIIGDYKSDYPPHPATTKSLEHVAEKEKLDLTIDWIPTENINGNCADLLNTYDAIWLGPAPYTNKEGVLKAVKHVRENNIPFIGTCGGLMQSIIEFGKNILLLNDDAFEISSTTGDDNLFVRDTSCGIHGFKAIGFRTVANTRTRKFYNTDFCREDSNCGFSINPKFHDLFQKNNLIIGGMDEQNEAKVFELCSNRYFVLTKFLPQMRSMYGAPHPLITAFVMAK